MWEYEKAVQKGNEVIITLKRDYTDENDEPQTERQSLNWGYTPDVGTLAQFKQMVKREVKYMLDHLNAKPTEKDITDEMNV